jgi:hypothetical protein
MKFRNQFLLVHLVQVRHHPCLGRGV